MPARHMGTTQIPTDVLIDLSRDPDRFETRMVEFDRRQVAAQEAEKKNAAVLQNVNNALDKLEKDKKTHAESVGKDEKRIRDEDDRLETMREIQGKENARLADWASRLVDREKSLNDRRNTLDLRDSGQNEREEQQDIRDRNLNALDEDLIGDRDDLMKRQSHLNANLADLRKRLEGFEFAE